MIISTVRTRIVLAFLIIIIAISIALSFFGYHVIGKYFLGEVQKEVENNLMTAWAAYHQKIEVMTKTFELVPLRAEVKIVKHIVGLDYLVWVMPQELENYRSELMHYAMDSKVPCGGSRIISHDELGLLGVRDSASVSVTIKPTPKARATEKQVLSDVMALEYVRPYYNAHGEVVALLCGGIILNNNIGFISQIADYVYESKLYQDKPVGTVTIFQDDVRIATNVLDDTGKPAIGTRVSAEVYHYVVERGSKWLAKAFVVTDWYITAYEPIRAQDGTIIGILYVGVLERPFIDRARQLFIMFLLIVAGASAGAMVLAYMLALSIARPVSVVVKAIKKISAGELKHKIDAQTTVCELNELLHSFNEMGERLDERERSLALSHQQLEALNKSYLDMIGFVSHELKGILASTVLNVHSVRGGYLGMINFKQRKVLDAIARTMDYLAATVKNFLNLSRIEKGELSLTRSRVTLQSDLVAESVLTFTQSAEEKHVEIVNEIDPTLEVEADSDQMIIVFNNLIGNAIKYGAAHGKIVVRATADSGMITVDIYNEGTPLTDDEQSKLFKRFSRVLNAESRKQKGTGLGLFITKEIIEKHGGTIRYVAREHGHSFVFTIPRAQ